MATLSVPSQTAHHFGFSKWKHKRKSGAHRCLACAHPCTAVLRPGWAVPPRKLRPLLLLANSTAISVNSLGCSSKQASAQLFRYCLFGSPNIRDQGQQCFLFKQLEPDASSLPLDGNSPDPRQSWQIFWQANGIPWENQEKKKEKEKHCHWIVFEFKWEEDGRKRLSRSWAAGPGCFSAWQVLKLHSQASLIPKQSHLPHRNLLILISIIS